MTRDDLDPLPGALVISLDFELLWGVRDRIGSDDPYRSNLLGARLAVPRILELLEEFEAAATWATVGFLFAASRSELEELSPALRPSYADHRLSPYEEEIGVDESEDPLHFALSLIERIRSTPRQEIATHTFSHFYCGEEGQNLGAFRADLEAAEAIAARRGITFRSIVFPRNQHNPRYDDTLLQMGITAFRGNPESYAWRFTDGAESRWIGKRAARLLDTYVSLAGSGTTPWSCVLQSNGLSNVRASYPLRPYQPRWRALEPLRMRRIKSSMRHAARHRKIFHLWWHPHNFGTHTEENLLVLRDVLEEMDRWRQEGAMVSLTMAEVTEMARMKAGLLQPKVLGCMSQS